MHTGSLGSGHYGIHNALLAQTSAASSTTSVADDAGTNENAPAATASGTAACDTALTGKNKASISNDMLAALTRMQEDPDMQASDAAPAQNQRGLPGDSAARKALHAPLNAAIAAQKAQADVVRDDTASLKDLRQDYKSAKGDKAARADLEDQIATLKALKQTDIAAFKADKAAHQSEAAALKAMKSGG